MAVRAAFRCQTCKNPLEFVGVPEPLDSRAAAAQDSRSGVSHNPASAPASTAPFGDSDDVPSPVHARPPAGIGAFRAMDESFVVLPSNASVMRSHATPLHPSPLGAAAAPQQTPLEAGEALVATFQAAAKIWDMASDEAALDHPLCRECAAALRKELEQQIAQAEQDCAAYETLLVELQEEQAAAAPADVFEREMQQLQAEAQAEEALLARDQAALREAEAELAAAKARSRELDEAEQSHEFDVEEFELQRAALEDDVEAVEARIRAANAQLEVLRRTHVFNEAFHIWHDGAFGTISGFRLGRTAATPVEWEEINAGWGQACLLLHTMAQVARITFSSYALLPMGSTSRVHDVSRGGAYDLFGPINPLNMLAAQRFNRAQVGFLACLAEFAAFAARRDAAAGAAKPFALPYAIDGDKVGGRSIYLPLTRDDTWTEALKQMLTDLKMLLSWFSRNCLEAKDKKEAS